MKIIPLIYVEEEELDFAPSKKVTLNNLLGKVIRLFYKNSRKNMI